MQMKMCNKFLNLMLYENQKINNVKINHDNNFWLQHKVPKLICTLWDYIWWILPWSTTTKTKSCQSYSYRKSVKKIFITVLYIYIVCEYFSIKNKTISFFLKRLKCTRCMCETLLGIYFVLNNN